ncbi:MAG: Holliday junction branch migration protein RuvA [Candidatus Babeliaceae bacterium]|nr:Holliday junction branch migration protein RuvA [Candidatus Babeliaceae bacterium]
MIDFVQGTVTSIHKQSVILSIGSWGLNLQIPHADQYELDKEYLLYLHLVWHPEQGPSWYAFAHKVERATFKLLIECSGIGARLALSLIDQLGAASCINALINGDAHLLSSISGVGLRKAETMIAQLKKRASVLAQSEEMPSAIESHNGTKRADLTQALKTLGYSTTEISRVFRQIQWSQEATISDLLKQALKQLHQPQQSSQT